MDSIFQRGALLLAFALAPTACDSETSPSTSGTTSSGGGDGGGGAGGGGGGSGGSAGSMAGTGGSAPMTCFPGEQLPCYTGPEETRDVGLCTDGVTTCLPDGSGFGACENEILPQPETCFTSGDDDCDWDVYEEGAEGCVCEPWSIFYDEPCYSGPPGTEGVGICKGGYRGCNYYGTGKDPGCFDEIIPEAETCDSLGDDDCDGVANEEGVSCVCVPGETKSCYAGPPGTEGVGACKAGTLTCNPMGTAFGACKDEVVPLPESCTVVDDDCDGLVNEENKSTPDCGAHFWSKRFGDAKNQTSNDVAVDASGNVAITGYFLSSFDFGGGTILTTEPNEQGIFVAMLSGAGDLLWAKGFGNTQGSFGFRKGTSLAFDPLGNLLVTGYVQGTVDFGNGPMQAVTGADGYIVKFDPQGNAIWSKRFGAIDEFPDIVVDGAGASVLTGTFKNQVDFGAGPHVSGGGASGDSYLAKFDADGQVLWSKSFGEGAIARVNDAAVDALGNVVVTGTLNGSKDFGTGILTSNKVDILVARYDPMGAPLSAKVYGGAGDQYTGWLVVDSSGSAIVTGVLGFGGSVLVHKTSSAGNVLWSKVWGDLSAQPSRIAVDAADNIFVTGHYSTSIDFGNGPLKATPTGFDDTFVAKISPAGTALWSRTYAVNDSVPVAIDPMGHMLLTGRFVGSVDFGGGALVSAGDLDVFLAKYGL